VHLVGFIINKKKVEITCHHVNRIAVTVYTVLLAYQNDICYLPAQRQNYHNMLPLQWLAPSP
jgi:hypothetical protein